MKASNDVGIQTMLSGKQSDQFGDFYLVRGMDGGLYRQNAASKDLYLLVPDGDWEMVSENAAENLNMQSNQKGIDSLEGRKIVLNDNYDPNYMSEKLMEVGVITRGLEAKAEEKILDKMTGPQRDPFISTATLEEDEALMPENDTAENLKTFLKDDTDTLIKELQK